MKTGFTLIELLVVVLIIGILSAVALPQYQKAVMKSRFASLKPIAKAVKDAQEFYFEEHGYYADESALPDLAIDIPEEVDVEIGEVDGHDYVRVNHDKLNNSYTMYLAHSENFANNIYCEALSTDEQAKSLCVAEGAQADPTENGDYLLYLLNGNSTGNFAPAYRDTFSGSSTQCDGSLAATDFCVNSLFTEGAECIAFYSWYSGCSGSTFDNSTCYAAYGDGSCSNSTFTNGSRCVVSGTAGSNHCEGEYDETSCCEEQSGGHCPASAPKC